MKLEIDVAELGYLLHRFSYHTAKHEGIFLKVAKAKGVQFDPRCLPLWWAWCLENYSLCALTPDEFLDAITEGERCTPEQFFKEMGRATKG